MTKLELTLSADSLECLSLSEQTCQVLGVQPGVNIASVLSDGVELKQLEMALRKLSTHNDAVDAAAAAFTTLNLVFVAPEGEPYMVADRTPVQGCFRSPIRPIHTAGEFHLACFVHLETSRNDQKNDGDANIIHLTALEYSREHRETLLQQEFGSWLLEDHIENAVIATDVMGNIVYWNRFAKELYQWEKDEVIGKSVVEVTPSKMSQEQAGSIFGLLVQGQHWKGLFGVKKRDGSEIMAYVIDTPVLDADGNLKFIVGISSDHTQLHNLMAELKELNENLELEVHSRTQQLLEKEESLRMVGAAIQESDTGVIIALENHKIIWSSNAAYTLLGQSESEVLGAFPWDLNFEFESDQAQNGPAAKAAAREFFKSDNFQISAFGAFADESDPASRICLSVRVQRLPGTNQQMIILRDVTAQRCAEESKLAVERALSASQSKTEMMQMLSHEFRTPLQGITGVASTMLVDMTRERDANFDNVSTILASSRLLLTLIGNVLDLGKMEADKMQEIDLRNVDVTSSIKDTLGFCDPFAAVNDVELIFEKPVGGDDFTVKADSLRLQQILINVVSNGIKYTEQNTSVVLSVRHCTMQEALQEAFSAGASDLSYLGKQNLGKNLLSICDKTAVTVVSIRDHGKGIPSHEFSALFGRFAQLEVSKEKDRNYNGSKNGNLVGQSPSGTGLGLNLVLQFVLKMNGHVWVDNCEPFGTGAIFSFCFPQGDPMPVLEDDSTRDSKSLRPAAELTQEEAESFRVLLVDDSLINLKVLARMLTRLGVKHIESCVNGRRAIENLGTIKDPKQYPNIILSDLNMPEMDGYELIKNLGAYDWKGERCPIAVACSADWTKETERTCLNAGFDYVIRKPISFSELKHFLASTANNDGFDGP